MSIESEIQSKGFLLAQEKTFVNVIFTGAMFYTQINIFLKKYNFKRIKYILRGLLKIQFNRASVQCLKSFERESPQKNADKRFAITLVT